MTDATNQIRSDYDTQVAIDMTVNDAVEVMNDWVRENEDKEIAKNLAQSLEAEEKKKLQDDVARGEAAALRVAIDETRRVKAEAKERETREQRDVEYAKAIYDAEEKDVKQSQQREEEDAKFARQLYDAAEEKSCDSPAAESKRDFKRDDKLDDKHADEDDEEFVRTMSAKFQALDADEELARREQLALDRARAEEEVSQQTKDFNLSRRLAVKTEREAHKQRKFKEMQQCFERCQRGKEAVATLWEHCEAEVEDVCDAVCITLLLPNLLDLKVRVVKNGRKVSIDAKRFVSENDRFSTPENSGYLAEFKVQGRNVQISDHSVSHDYSSDSGLLHIYIEGVSLQDNQASAAESSEYTETAAAGSSGKASSAKMIAAAVRSGFLRVFGGSSSSSKH